MRIAWLGPTPNADGGAPYVGTQLLRELARAGAQIDCFLDVGPDQIPPALLDVEGLQFVLRPTNWRWGRWYNQTPLRAFVSGKLFRLRAQVALAKSVADRHASAPYDVVYQFSQSELGALRSQRGRLPPIVVHPSTHAAGELRWHKREAPFARAIEPRGRRALVRAVLTVRAAIQRREMAKADRVLSISRRFAQYLADDYEIPRERIGIVVNPIDLERFRPAGPELARSGPLTLLFVSRIAVRKGVELVVDLSHRLDDLRGEVELVVIGGPSTWSDYRKLLDDLNPRIARYLGSVAPDELARLYREAVALLAPSHYEPFALTVGEALAGGTPVIVSDEVGAADGVDPRVCKMFPRGDRDAFERVVRDAIASAGSVPRELARAEAQRLFAPATVAATLLEELERAARSADHTPTPSAGHTPTA